jgi:hypothetical protein
VGEEDRSTESTGGGEGNREEERGREKANMVLLYLLSEEEDGLDGGKGIEESCGDVLLSLVNPSEQQSGRAISCPCVVSWSQRVRESSHEMRGVRSAEQRGPSILFTWIRTTSQICSAAEAEERAEALVRTLFIA